MRLRLISSAKVEYEGEVDMVLLPADDGEMGILPNHMEMIASLAEGDVKIHKGSKVETINIKGGIVSVSDDNKIDVMMS